MSKVSIQGATNSYSHGDKTLAFHSCAVCGCTTHWENLKPEADDKPYMAVNLRLAAADVVAGVPVRHFDGAETWAFID